MRRGCAARWIWSGSRSGLLGRILQIRKEIDQNGRLQIRTAGRDTRKGARIKVIGVGGGGSNAVGRMYEEGLDGVEFYVMNTDAQALEASKVPNKIQIGAKITERSGRGFRSGDRTAGGARRYRAHSRHSRRRGPGVRHGRAWAAARARARRRWSQRSRSSSMR